MTTMTTMTTATNHPPAGAHERTFLRLVGWLAVLALAHLTLLAAARSLPLPDAGSPSQLLAWVQRNDPTLTSFTVVRLVATALTWYLTVLTLAAVLARVSGRAAFHRLVYRVTAPCFRRLVQQIIGAGLAATIAGCAIPLVTAGATPAGAGPSGPPVVTMHVVDEPTSSAVPAHRPDADGTTTIVTMVLVDPPSPAAPPIAGADTTTASPPPSSDAESARPAPDAPDSPDPRPPDPIPGGTEPVMRAEPTGTAAPVPLAGDPTTVDGDAGDEPVPVPPGDTSNVSGDEPAPPAAGHASTWTIQPGDHLWRVADATMAIALGRAPTDTETAGYWRQLIDANLDRLVVAGNADLVYPGQVFVLPDVS